MTVDQYLKGMGNPQRFTREFKYPCNIGSVDKSRGLTNVLKEMFQEVNAGIKHGGAVVERIDLRMACVDASTDYGYEVILLDFDVKWQGPEHPGPRGWLIQEEYE